MNGRVFRIKRFSVHDGPGIRTSVFLKGCALRCVWCHSPEGLFRGIEVWHDRSLCIACGKCVESCSTKAVVLNREEKSLSIDRDLCSLKGDCVDVCPSTAMQFTGKVMASEEVVEEVEKDRVFYESSGGGITLTGGEPFFQPDFSSAILAECRKRKIHTAVETCLFGQWPNIKDIVKFTDLFIVDLKIFDSRAHKMYTGHDNRLIFENFRKLATEGKEIIVRIPLVKNITDTADNIGFITTFVKSVSAGIPIEKIEYNPLARNNYDRLEMPFRLKET